MRDFMNFKQVMFLGAVLMLASGAQPQVQEAAVLAREAYARSLVRAGDTIG